MEYGIINQEIEEQIHQLFSSILLEQQKYNSVKPPNEEKSHLIENTLKEFSQLRGKDLFYNYLSSGRGHGPFSELVDGSIKYDLIGGIGVNLLGHSHPLYIKAHLETATSDSIMCGNLLTYPQAVGATRSIVEQVKKSRLRHFWYAGSGSFANDLGLKLIWQKMAPKYKVIAFNNSFAGRSVATQDITFNENYRQGMPRSVHVEHVPHFDQSDPQGATSKTLKALDAVWEADPDNYCCLIIELIQGEAGFVYGDKEYYKQIFEWARKKGIYIWVDEIQTFGRTHELFSYQMFGLDEYVDVVTVGKALQACGTLFTEELNPKPGLIAGTFNGSLVGLNMASKTIRYLTEGNFYGENGRIHQLEREFIGRLNHMANKSCKGLITYVGGIGTMISFEIGDSKADTTKKFLKALFDNGIIAFSAGRDPVRVRFLLPLSLTDRHIDEIFLIIGKTLKQVLK